MALTQIKTGGIADDAVTSAKIPDDAIGASEIADGAVSSEIEFAITNSGTDHWVFSGDTIDGNQNDPTLYVYANTTYKFKNNASSGTNAFHIQVEELDGSWSWTDAASEEGVTNNGATGGNTLTWKVPNSVGTAVNGKSFKYLSKSNGSMTGSIYVIGSPGAPVNYNIKTGGSASDSYHGFQVTGHQATSSSSPLSTFGRYGAGGNYTVINGGGSDIFQVESGCIASNFVKGKVTLSSYDTNLVTPGELKIEGGGTSNTTGCTIKGAATANQVANWTLELPGNVASANNQVLKSTTAGVTSWANTIDTITDDTITEAKLDISNTASDGQYLQYKDSTDKLTWATVSTDPTTTSGTNNFTVADGDLVIGTAGHGISFAATADTSKTGASMANELLDDYEKGTWTADLYYNWSGNAGFSSAPQQDVGTYVKIGDIVHAQCYVYNFTMNSGENSDANIKGLPFIAANVNEHFWLGNITYSNAFNETDVHALYLNKGDDNMRPTRSDGDAAPHWNPGSSRYFMMQITYST
jgi:hypothetical protein